MSQTNNTNKNILNNSIFIALIAILLWSSQAIILDITFQQTDFSAILFAAFSTSFIFLIFYRMIQRFLFKKTKQIVKDFPKQIFYIAIGTILFFSYHWLLFLGLHTGPVVETNLTNFLWPILFILLGNIILKRNVLNSNIMSKIISYFKSYDKNENLEDKLMADTNNNKCDSLRILKIISGFVGIGFLLTRGNINDISFANWEGPIYGLCAAICWAVFSIFLKFHGSVSNMLYYVFGTAFLSGAIWWFRGCPDFYPALKYTIYLGVFPLGIAMIAWEKAMKTGKTHIIGSLGFLAPLFSTIFLYLSGSYFFNMISFLGGGCVIFANIPVRFLIMKIKERIYRVVKIRENRVAETTNQIKNSN